MKSLSVAQRRPRAYAVVLSGCRATYTHDFRRKSHRFRDLLGSLGFPVRAATVNSYLIFGHLLTLLIICAGVLWAPQSAGLTSLGIPLSTPDIVSIVAVLLALALLQARRRFTQAHRCWNTVSARLEAGMRGGLVLLDLGLAFMLITQNLRWHEVSNLLAAGALFVSSVLVVSPLKRAVVRTLAVLVVAIAVGSISIVIADVPWANGVRTLGSGSFSKILITAIGTLFTAIFTPLLYKLTVHSKALQSRELLTDLSIKAASIFLFAGLILSIVEMTPWPLAAPFIALAIFFLGLVLYRSSFARISSPETLGFALFLVRLRPAWVKPIILRSLLTSLVVVAPLTLALSAALILNQYTQVAILLVTLVVLEISIDALIIQRRTAVLPAPHISRLAQKSKAGMGAALCAGLAVVFSGILGTVSSQTTESHWLGIASGALALVAFLLTALVLNDAPAWLRELSATETEDA